VKKKNILDAYIKFETRLYFYRRKKEKFKVNHKKNEEKGEFESL
jgi:hypothetical protein